MGPVDRFARWDFGHAVAEVAGGYVVAGYGYGMAFGSQDVFLAKFDLQGNLVFDRVLGGVYAEGCGSTSADAHRASTSCAGLGRRTDGHGR